MTTEDHPRGNTVGNRAKQKQSVADGHTPEAIARANASEAFDQRDDPLYEGAAVDSYWENVVDTLLEAGWTRDNRNVFASAADVYNAEIKRLFGN